MDNRSETPAAVIACPDCDLLMKQISPGPGQKIVCPRCGHHLCHFTRDTISKSIAISLAGLIIFFPAIFSDLLTFSKLGMQETGNIFTTVTMFYDSGYYLVSITVFLSCVLFPFIKLLLLFLVSTTVKFNKYTKSQPILFRYYSLLEEWAMVEVFLLGILVTIIKMYHSMEIIYGVGFFSYSALVIMVILSSLYVNKETIWDLIEIYSPNRHRLKPETVKKILASKTPITSKHNLLLCRCCHKLMEKPVTRDSTTLYCPRCTTRLHSRKPRSVERTWALILSAAVLLIPANLLPIMRVDFLGRPTLSTILDGIILFYQDGSYGIALIILTASILIPIFKVLGLGIVLLTIQLGRNFHLRQKTQLFRVIEFIGRWSMLDIFVIGILGGFVNFGFFTSIDTAPAATYFCLAVIATMFAALTLDPRLMWDIVNQNISEDLFPKDRRTLNGEHSSS